LIKNNPVFKLLLGLCPTLAVTTSAVNGLGMGLATTFVLFFSNSIVSLLKKRIPIKIRIPLFIIVIVTFVTVVDLVMAGFVPELHKSLGIFIPLIVVNCIVLGRAEAYAYKYDLLKSITDAFINGAGFTFALVLLAAMRELLGNGTIFNVVIFPPTYQPMLIMILPPGAFLLLGVIIAVMNTKKESSDGSL